MTTLTLHPAARPSGGRPSSLILGVPLGVVGGPGRGLPTAARPAIAGPVRPMARCRDSWPVGTRPPHDRTRQAHPQSRPGGTGRAPDPAGTLYGLALVFGERSAAALDLPPETRAFIGTAAASAHVTFLPGCFDRSLEAAAGGGWHGRIDLLFGHDPARRLCSTAGGALKVYLSGSALLFRVRGRTADGREAVRAAARRPFLRQVSAGCDLRRFQWREPNRPGGPGELLIRRGDLWELSLVEAGAFGGTFAVIA